MPLLARIKGICSSNAYWLQAVVLNCQAKPQMLDNARTLEADFASITRKELNALAKEYLPSERALMIGVIARPPKDTASASTAPEQKLPVEAGQKDGATASAGLPPSPAVE
jgi:hypothetical protein